MRTTTRRNLIAAALVGAVAACTGHRAQAQPPDPADAAAPVTPVAPAADKGLVPVPEYSGDLLHRSHLAGDFSGARTGLANKGVQFHIDWVQTVQSVVEGGRDSGTKYGGSLDYLLNIDLYRMGLMPGALVKIRAETRYGESVNAMSGSILPVNTDGFFPLHFPLDDAIPITVTDLTYYQYLSEKFGVFFGKLDTLDSDLNEFASGRGNTQFMNTQLVFASPLALMPYSTLGGGVMAAPTKNIAMSSVVVDLNDSSTSSGFSDFGHSWAWATEADFQYRLGKLPGGTNFGAVYLWNTEFFDFGGRFTFDHGEGFVAPDKSDSWIAYWSGWQYLFTKDQGEGPLNLQNGQPDRQGFGIFWRAAVADEDVNPTKWSLSGGVGGKGMIPARERDFFGIGYYYNSVQTTRLTGTGGLDDHTQGLECFYNIALTPAAQLTIDAQVIDSVQSEVDTAVVLGTRLKLEF
jgi:porin